MKIKFNRLLVSIIGAVLLIGIGCLMFFLVVKPAMETLKSKQAELEPLKQYNEEMLASTEQKKVEEFKKADMVESLYDSYMSRFMPMLDFGRRDTGMIDYWHEYANIKKVLENFGNDPNLTTTISLTVPNPPTNPNNSLFDQPFIKYSGTVTVTGDFNSILDNIVRWSSAPRLVLVNNNSISMTMSGDDSNMVTCSYTIDCYVIPWTSGGPKIDMATGGGAASAQGAGSDAMMGGMPGGMSGMPGGMSGAPGVSGPAMSGTMSGAPAAATSGSSAPYDK